MRLDPGERDALVASIRVRLTEAVSGSVTSLRGSLAEGRADAYSDIDLLWEVPVGTTDWRARSGGRRIRR